MPASVYSTIQRLGARAVVAERDFSWQVESSEGQTEYWGDPWSYRGPHISLSNLPASALAGTIQYRNASASIAAIESLDAGYALTEQTVGEALRSVRLPGRFQVVSGPVEWILDIAHNEPAARTFAQHVRERSLPGEGHTFAVVGILTDKDAREIAAALEPLVDHWILCSLPGARGGSALDLAQRLRLPPDEVTLATSVEEGCEVARAAAVPGDRVIVFGSVYTVGPALQWLRVY
jgi:dihydrofolate synthase/folylpolyglutamate synthase